MWIVSNLRAVTDRIWRWWSTTPKRPLNWRRWSWSMPPKHRSTRDQSASCWRASCCTTARTFTRSLRPPCTWSIGPRPITLSSRSWFFPARGATFTACTSPTCTVSRPKTGTTAPSTCTTWTRANISSGKNARWVWIFIVGGQCLTRGDTCQVVKYPARRLKAFYRPRRWHLSLGQRYLKRPVLTNYIAALLLDRTRNVGRLLGAQRELGRVLHGLPRRQAAHGQFAVTRRETERRPLDGTQWFYETR